MRRVLLGLVLAFGLAAGFAHAADKPVIGPPGDWVKPMAFVPPKGGDTEAATRLLSMDQQLHFGPDGDTTYLHSYIRIQTNQGLASVGTIALPWKPDTTTLTIHQLRILRGDQVIDVLASQEFTVLRRENRLEYAMLDGVLTATIQPEGLEVGDILELAISMTTKDPVLAGLSSDIVTNIPDAPIDQMRLRLVWDQPKVLKWRVMDGLEAPKVTRRGKETELLFDVRNLEPWRVPENAPARFRYGRGVEISEFTSWAQVSSLFAPLYDRAATLSPSSPLRAEIAKIKAASSDPVEQAAAALALVQGKVRYVFLGMNDGGLTPATADSTWSRRYGDCKGKTALLLAILHELGIQAQPAVVNTIAGDGLDEQLPLAGSFDHVLVRAVIGGKTYWLDGTRTGDVRLAEIDVPAFKWALPIQAKDGKLERLVQSPLLTPRLDVSLRLDASAGLDMPAPAHAEHVFRGDAAVELRQSLGNLTSKDQDSGLRNYWKEQYAFIEPTAVTYDFNARTGELKLVMDGKATMEWFGDGGTTSKFYEIDGARLGSKTDLKREPGPHRDAPFVSTHPIYNRAEETIILPSGVKGFTVEGENVDRVVGVIQYRRTAAVEKGVFTMKAEVRSLDSEFPAAEASKVQKGLEDLYKVRVFVRSPAAYVPTAVEKADKLSAKPEDFEGFINRGLARLRFEDYPGAEEDFSRSIKLKPDAALGYSNRSLTRSMRGDLAGAKADLAKTSALTDDDDLIALPQAMIAHAEGRNAEAIAAYTRALVKKPDDLFMLIRRAQAYVAVKEQKSALADLNAALKVSPESGPIQAYRAEVLQLLRRDAEALIALDAAISLTMDNAELRLHRSLLLYGMGRKVEAKAALDAVIAEKATAEALLARIEMRDAADVTGAMADAEAAIKLDPRSPKPLVYRATLYSRGKDYERAQADLTRALALDPRNPVWFVRRGEAFAHLGQKDKALVDFAAARREGGSNATLLNDICWTQATANVALEEALSDCDAALKLAPGTPAIMDSRAFTLLRLNRLDEAIAGYDAALKRNPKLEASLYGRGLARIKKRQDKEGLADIRAAIAIEPEVARRFEGYGFPTPQGVETKTVAATAK